MNKENMKLNAFQIHGQIPGETSDWPPISYVALIWPGHQLMIFSPPTDIDPVNSDWLREILDAAKATIQRKTERFCFLDQWQIFIDQSPLGFVKVNQVDGGDFDFAACDNVYPAIRALLEIAKISLPIVK